MPNLNQYIIADNALYKVLQQELQYLIESTNQFESSMKQKMRHQVYNTWYQRNTTQPDYVFNRQWTQLELTQQEYKSWSLAIFKPLVKYYFDKGDKVSIQTQKFNEWQTSISNNSSLPALACKFAQFEYGEDINETFHLLDTLKQKLGYCPYLSPDELLLEKYIRDARLYEIHMHLNGTSSFEHCWYQALVQPDRFIQTLQGGQESEKVKLLYVINPYLQTLSDYHHLLLLARSLREGLLTWLVDSNETPKNNELIDIKKQILQVIKGDTDNLTSYLEYERKQFGNINSTKNDKFIYDLSNHAHIDTHIRELHWQVRVQYKLLNQSKEKPEVFFDIAYLLYIVCMNSLHRLFVQRSDQYGFDNFQKFAEDNARELAEKTYKNRFFQLHGPYRDGHSDMAVVEGRFAPKDIADKNSKLIREILVGFIQYSQEVGINNLPDPSLIKNSLISYDLSTLVKEANNQSMRLYLVAHFIKKPEKSDNSYNFISLRKDLWNRATVLMDMLEAIPELRTVVQGIDAAANELDTPPEVFAPIYSYCRRKGIKHFTYHVGEDFENLVSGIRAIFEAIKFLQLQNGDRLGHATAIGIHPKHWQKSAPKKIYLKRGEWLDNLIFIQKMMLAHDLQGFNVLDLDTKISSLYHQIYKDAFQYRNGSNNCDLSQLNIHILQLAYSYRYLDPEKVQAYLNDKINILSQKEFNELEKLDKRALELAEVTWFNAVVRSRRQELIYIDNKSFTYQQIIELQQCVQKIICEKKIIIESLLTSNVRISHYQSLNDHHIFRWLSIKNRAVKGDAKMQIILGSDDPGIFATDLRGEYYHLYSALKSKFGYTDSKSLKVIKKLNNNSQVYHFH